MPEWMSPVADVFGRLHPLILHLPIGLIVGIVVVEAVAIWRSRRRKRANRAAPAMLLWLTAAASLLAIATGLKLASEDGYGGRTLDLHQWLGFAVGAGAVLAAFLRTAAGPRPRPAWLWAYRGTLLVTFGLIGAAGHLGASMTHGENFLFEPFETYARAAETADAPTESAVDAAANPSPAMRAALSEEGFAEVSPILAQRCFSCHSGSRTRGGLALDSFDGLLTGGHSGPAVALDAPESSELLRRILLPLEHDEHMPPEGRQQLTPEQIAAVEAWIQGGPTPPDVLAEASEENQDAAAEEASTTTIPPADPAAVAALAETLAHISPTAAGSDLFWVDMSSAFPALKEPQIIELLRPLAPNIVELTLARCSISDEFAELAADMPNLTRLNLSGTPVSDATVAALATHPTLTELVLTQTKVSDGAVDHLLEMPALQRIYLWGSQCTDTGLERLRDARQDLLADAGEFRDSQVLVEEPEPKLVEAAPAPPPAASASLEPTNATCPVSANPVNPQYLVVHEGQVIGFCCPDCPKQFWADPETFVAKLK